MRRSSRRLPAQLPSRPSPQQRVLPWLAMLACLAAAAVVCIQHPVEAGTIAIVMVLWVAWSIRRERARLHAIAATRPGESICGFARSFDLRRTDPLVVRAVHERLQLALANSQPAFPVRASDRLEQDLGLDADDLDMDIAPALAQRTGRSLANTAANPFYGKVTTVSDLVCFFNHQPEHAA